MGRRGLAPAEKQAEIESPGEVIPLSSRMTTNQREAGQGDSPPPGLSRYQGGRAAPGAAMGVRPLRHVGPPAGLAGFGVREPSIEWKA